MDEIAVLESHCCSTRPVSERKVEISVSSKIQAKDKDGEEDGVVDNEA